MRTWRLRSMYANPSFVKIDQLRSVTWPPVACGAGSAIPLRSSTAAVIPTPMITSSRPAAGIHPTHDGRVRRTGDVTIPR